MAPSGHVRKALPELHGQGGACGWHRLDTCGLHRQNLADLGTDLDEIHVDVDSVGENLADNRVALPGDTRAALPGNVQAAPSGRVWSATLKLETVLSFVYCQSTTTEGCHGTKDD